MSISWSDYDNFDGTIAFGIDRIVENVEYGSDMSLINIRYRGVEENNVTHQPINMHKMHNITYEKTTRRIYSSHESKVDIFHFPDTNLTVEIRDKKIIIIKSNNLDMNFEIIDEKTYRKIIRDFKKAITEVKHARLNTVNTNELKLPDNIQARIGSFLTGYNGTIAQQRAQIGRRPEIGMLGGKHKTRKQRRQHKYFQRIK